MPAGYGQMFRGHGASRRRTRSAPRYRVHLHPDPHLGREWPGMVRRRSSNAFVRTGWPTGRRVTGTTPGTRAARTRLGSAGRSSAALTWTLCSWPCSEVTLGDAPNTDAAVLGHHLGDAFSHRADGATATPQSTRVSRLDLGYRRQEWPTDVIGEIAVARRGATVGWNSRDQITYATWPVRRTASASDHDCVCPPRRAGRCRSSRCRIDQWPQTAP